jgi:hypothetical protein
LVIAWRDEDLHRGAGGRGHCVEADRRRADDYYLAEGTGIARRYTVGDGRVEELAPLTYEAVRQDPTLINLRDL